MTLNTMDGTKRKIVNILFTYLPKFLDILSDLRAHELANVEST